jgi:hypothetical protein
MTAEHKRLEEARTQNIPWKKWGPCLSERQWGTVREDYSESGAAWELLRPPARTTERLNGNSARAESAKF